MFSVSSDVSLHIDPCLRSLSGVRSVKDSKLSDTAGQRRTPDCLTLKLVINGEIISSLSLKVFVKWSSDVFQSCSLELRRGFWFFWRIISWIIFPQMSKFFQCFCHWSTGVWTHWLLHSFSLKSACRWAVTAPISRETQTSPHHSVWQDPDLIIISRKFKPISVRKYQQMLFYDLSISLLRGTGAFSSL